jgi:hypothetical protein
MQVIYLFLATFIFAQSQQDSFRSAVVYFETETLDKAKKSCIQFWSSKKCLVESAVALNSALSIPELKYHFSIGKLNLVVQQ